MGIAVDEIQHGAVAALQRHTARCAGYYCGYGASVIMAWARGRAVTMYPEGEERATLVNDLTVLAMTEDCACLDPCKWQTWVTYIKTGEWKGAIDVG